MPRNLILGSCDFSNRNLLDTKGSMYKVLWGSLSTFQMEGKDEASMVWTPAGSTHDGQWNWVNYVGEEGLIMLYFGTSHHLN